MQVIQKGHVGFLLQDKGPPLHVSFSPRRKKDGKGRDSDYNLDLVKNVVKKLIQIKYGYLVTGCDETARSKSGSINTVETENFMLINLRD